MIELDEVRELRADVPAMSDAAYQRGLSRLQAAQQAGRRGHRGRYALLAAAVVAALAAGVVSVGHHHPSDLAAGAILEDAAVQALRQPSLHPKHGQYVYQRVEHLDGGTPSTVEYWIPADGTGREVIASSDSGSTVLPAYDRTRPLYEAPYDVLAALPATGPAMLARLRSDPATASEQANGKSPDLAVWTVARDLADVLPAAQQAALFRAMASLSSVKNQGRVTTFQGQAGIAIGIEDPNLGNVQLVFAAVSHAFVGERIIEPGQRTAEFNSVRKLSAVVNRVRQRP